MTQSLPAPAPRASPEFNAWCVARLRDAGGDLLHLLGRNGRAVLVVGPWGRGEGSVVFDGARERPYLPIDLLVVVDNPAAVDPADLRHALLRHDEAFAGRLRILPPLGAKAIAALPATADWHEAAHGHAALAGDADLFARSLPPAVRGHPPPIEAARLALAAGVRLLAATRIVRGLDAEPEPDFCRRALHDALLGLGDALLIAAGCHRPSFAYRDAVLEDLAAEDPAVRALGLVMDYRLALVSVAFPEDAWIAYPAAHRLRAAARRWAEVLLHIERRRLGGGWSSLGECASAGALLGDGAKPAPWRADPGKARRRMAAEAAALLAEGAEDDPQWPARGAALLAQWNAAHPPPATLAGPAPAG